MRCPKCNSLCLSSAKGCLRCGASLVAGAGHGWSCDACRHSNSEAATTCAACGVPRRGVSGPELGEVGRGRVPCEACGRMNPPGSRSCDKCGVTLTGVLAATLGRKVVAPPASSSRVPASRQTDRAAQANTTDQAIHGVINTEAFSFIAEDLHSDVKRCAIWIRESPFVKKSERHWELASRTQVFLAAHAHGSESLPEHLAQQIDLPVDLVNAFAAEGDAPMIVVLEGYCRVCRYAATALVNAHSADGSSIDISYLRESLAALGQSIKAGGARFTLESACALVLRDHEMERATPFHPRMRTYFAGMLMEVLAHELGHILLGHTNQGPLPDPARRKNEHLADMFAAQVIEQTEYSEVNALSGFVSRLTDVYADGGGVRTTHPEPRERLRDYVRDNQELHRWGVNLESLPAFLP